MLLHGKYHEWKIGDYVRRYSIITMPYGQFENFCSAYTYDAITGVGEQRELFSPHAKTISRAMEENTYTPTPISIGLHESHRSRLKIDPKDQVFRLETSGDDDKLPLTDGNHRLTALSYFLARAKNVGDENLVNDILRLPITFTLYLDGDTQRDFANLQMGRPVDKAHMLSLKLQKLINDPDMHMAFDICRKLNEERGSPLEGTIRFDSHSDKDSVLKKMPISTLCSKSDLSTSAIGWAKVANSAQFSENHIVKLFIDGYKYLVKKDEGIFDQGKLLTPPGKGGTRGAATLLIGIGLVWTYRMAAVQRKRPSDKDYEILFNSVNEVLNQSIDDPTMLSAPNKRALMGQFAGLVLADNPAGEEVHEGIPMGLIELTSVSTWGLGEIPGKSRGRGRPRKAVV